MEDRAGLFQTLTILLIYVGLMLAGCKLEYYFHIVGFINNF